MLVDKVVINVNDDNYYYRLVAVPVVTIDDDNVHLSGTYGVAGTTFSRRWIDKCRHTCIHTYTRAVRWLGK